MIMDSFINGEKETKGKVGIKKQFRKMKFSESEKRK